MKKLLFAVSVLATAAGFAASPKYVFLFIGDGMSFSSVSLAEAYLAQSGVGLNVQRVVFRDRAGGRHGAL